MQDITKEVSGLAKMVQDESLCFGCASALYGLTKLFYDLDRIAFDSIHLVELSELKKKCRDAAIIHGDQASYDEAMREIEKLQRAKDNIALKFFYIKFYDIPLSIQQKAEQEKLQFGARLDSPDVFSTQPSVESSDLWNNVYLITISNDIMNEILSDDEWTEERKSAKEEQRRLTAHEMAHQIFLRFDPDGSLGLDSEKNAAIFAEELLRYRKYYINGSPAFPRIKLNQSQLTTEIRNWFNNQTQTEFAEEIASTMPEWLESVLNSSSKQIIEFDKKDAD